MAMKLDIREGAHLYTASGEDLGTIREFVVDPSSADLTHVLVEKGVFFTDDRVVPIEAIDHVDDGNVVLDDGIDASGLPRFVREDYAPIDDQTRERIGAPAGYMWRYPTTQMAPFPIYPTYPMPADVEGQRQEPEAGRSNLPEGEVIGHRTPVISLNGEKVGTVSEMQVDEAGQLSHLVVDLGFLSDERILPARWIESMDTDGVHLAVSNQAVESLETIT